MAAGNVWQAWRSLALEQLWPVMPGAVDRALQQLMCLVTPHYKLQSLASWLPHQQALLTRVFVGQKGN